MTALIVDDHPVLAHGARQVLEARGVVCEVVTKSADALAFYDKHQPDIVVCDVELGDTSISGIELTAAIRRTWSQARVIMFSANAMVSTVQACLEAGATGYISKQADADEMYRCVVSGAEGNLSFDTKTSGAMITALMSPEIDHLVPGEALKYGLTAREHEVLNMMCEAGSTTRRISEQLMVTPSTVRSHIDKILHKLGEHERLGAATKAFREGLVSKRLYPAQLLEQMRGSD